MKTFEFEAYEIFSTDGYNERHEGYCSSYELAQKFLYFKKLGAYGRVASKSVKKSFVIYETEHEFREEKTRKLLESAKSKLTKEELEALISSFK